MPTGVYEHKKKRPVSEETRQKIREANSGPRSHMWKGGMPKCLGCQKQLSSYRAKRCIPCFQVGRRQTYVGVEGKDHYWAVHDWIQCLNGAAKLRKCEHCDEQAKDWANMSGEYKRIVEDWISLCRKCHRKFDNHVDKWRATVKERHGWNVA